MKRTIACLLILALLFSPAGCGKTENEGIKTVDGEPAAPRLAEGVAAEGAEDFALIDGELWVIENGKVHTVGGDPKTLAAPSDFTPAFLTADGKSPVLCTKSGTVLWDGETILLPIPEKEPEVTSFAVAGDTAVAAYRHTEGSGDEVDRLIFYNRASGDTITADPIQPGFARIAACDGERVWVFNTSMISGVFVYRYNVRTMQTDIPYSRPDMWSDFGWDAADGLLYLGEVAYRPGAGGWERRMTAYDPETREAYSVAVPDILGTDAVKYLLSDGYLLVMNENGTVTVSSDAFDAEDDERAVTLLVLSGTPLGKPVSESVMERLNPYAEAADIRLTVKELTAEQINVKLLAGDDDFDLFAAPSLTFNPSKPFWEPLESYPAIAEQIDKMLPDAVRLCSYDGHFFGVPTSGYSGGLFDCIREETMEKIGMTAEEAEQIGMLDGTWTLDDYYDLAVRAKAAGCSISPGFGITFGEYAARYFDPERETLTDTEGTALRKLLLHMKRMQDEELLTDKTQTPNWDSSPDVLLHNYLSFDDTTAVSSGKKLAWQPTVNGERGFLISFDYTVMNKASRHKDAAAELLAVMLDPDAGYTQLAQGKWDLWLYKNAEKQMKTDAARSNWERYLAMMPYFRTQAPYTAEFVGFAEEESAKYLHNEQDLDYTVKRIIDRAKMVLNG